MNVELLEAIGLTKSEIKVYLALLELGSSTTGPIVEKSGASSSKIYEILEKLIQKGLVGHVIKAGKKHFEAAPPALSPQSACRPPDPGMRRSWTWHSSVGRGSRPTSR